MFTIVSCKRTPLVTCLGFIWTSFYLKENLIYFSILLKINTITSLLFWWDIDQRRYTIVHKIDGFFAKLSIGSIIFYKVVVEHTNITAFVITTYTMLCFFTLSHIHSSENWGCNKHIISHTFAHIFAIISIYFAFLHNMWLCLQN
jgi:hypothetical protein